MRDDTSVGVDVDVEDEETVCPGLVAHHSIFITSQPCYSTIIAGRHSSGEFHLSLQFGMQFLLDILGSHSQWQEGSQYKRFLHFVLNLFCTLNNKTERI